MQGYIVMEPRQAPEGFATYFNARWILSSQNDELQERMSEDKKKSTG